MGEAVASKEKGSPIALAGFMLVWGLVLLLYAVGAQMSTLVGGQHVQATVTEVGKLARRERTLTLAGPDGAKYYLGVSPSADYRVGQRIAVVVSGSSGTNALMDDPWESWTKALMLAIVGLALASLGTWLLVDAVRKKPVAAA